MILFILRARRGFDRPFIYPFWFASIVGDSLRRGRGVNFRIFWLREREDASPSSHWFMLFYPLHKANDASSPLIDLSPRNHDNCETHRYPLHIDSRWQLPTCVRNTISLTLRSPRYIAKIGLVVVGFASYTIVFLQLLAHTFTISYTLLRSPPIPCLGPEPSPIGSACLTRFTS